ncbi:uncharacterized protein B0H18DRAFT_886481 [Fomitopsis serialis]|uniref:uncharacterized protein n=1 Tax=Fomitopsis serialis TaxID=139415 RepID=UPI00200891B5|nr:uncharacterized protein B0H18DRAFT_886481 [Neoantrodia serialis]KAH9914945.1 hypothetical protein B0H18DRAFT_886481 [Neoantrodia serialis]
MVNWQSETEIEADSVAFSRFMHALLGLYCWEFFSSLLFDWDYISGKRKFRWPMIFYFAGRYFLLFALVGIAIALDVTKEVNCQALYTYNQVFGNSAIGLASINLSIRTMAVWSQALYIVIPLIAVILGHWSLLLHGIYIKAAWISGQGCAITNTNNKLLAATFIYSMAFDFAVLMLTGWKLAFPGNSRRKQSKIMQLVFGDGLIYFFVAFLANLLATIFMLLNLNAVMSIIANVPAAIASTIVACRVVRRLATYTSSSVEIYGCVTSVVFSLSGVNSTIAFSSGNRSRTVNATESVPSDPSFVQYDATGRVMKGDVESYIVDSPMIAGDDEYKRPEY